MGHNIEAGFDLLVDQASKTANTYLRDAAEAIDKLYGKGHAEKHPALLVACLQAASADFNHAMLKLAAQDIRDGMRELAEAIANRAD